MTEREDILTGREGDAASAQADSFLSELVPQAADRLAARHAAAYDASAGKARFDAWLASHASGLSHEDSQRTPSRRRGWWTARRRVDATVMAALISGVMAVLAVFIDAGIALPHPGSSLGPVVPPPSASVSPQLTQSPGATRGGLYTEMTDNSLGTAVFRDPRGGAVTSGPLSIPFGTRVSVKCWAPNESGMDSINAFYLVETSPWTGEYAPANTFLNADTTGSLDPEVPEC